MCATLARGPATVSAPQSASTLSDGRRAAESCRLGHGICDSYRSSGAAAVVPAPTHVQVLSTAPRRSVKW